MKRTSAFTLVEIIVVIAIVLVLAAILVPVTNRAVLAAKESKGIEHLRQIHQIHMLYQADHGGGGGYGSASQMGFPTVAFLWGRDVAPDWYAAAPYGMSTTIHKAPCGPKENDDRITMQFWEEWLAFYSPLYMENTTIAVHWQCSTAPREAQFLLKRSSAVMLSGTAVTRTGYGSMTDPKFYSEL